MKKIFNHLYALVLYRFILLLLVYSIIRIIYYLCNLGLYTDISTSHLFILLGAGIPFDITAILYINLLYLLLQIIPFQFRYNISYQKILKVLFIVSIRSSCFSILQTLFSAALLYDVQPFLFLKNLEMKQTILASSGNFLRIIGGQQYYGLFLL